MYTGEPVSLGGGSMTKQDILHRFTRILSDLLDDESVALTMETRREDVAGWDSFNYVNFIAAAEIELGVKFSVADVESFENVGAVVNQTEKLLAQQLRTDAHN
jgi:acyl carrier protein